MATDELPCSAKWLIRLLTLNFHKFPYLPSSNSVHPVLLLCNAGHNPPILIYPDGQVSYLEFKTQIFVGVVEDFKYSDEEVVLEKESKLFLYTDGVTEAENINKELYGEEKLLEMLSDNASSDVRTTVNVVVDSIASHVKEAEASDDLTILLIQYEPGTANS